MPKRNYGFEKRQKELDKKRKKEEKMQRRSERAANAPEENESDATVPPEPKPEE